MKLPVCYRYIFHAYRRRYGAAIEQRLPSAEYRLVASSAGPIMSREIGFFGRAREILRQAMIVGRAFIRWYRNVSSDGHSCSPSSKRREALRIADIMAPLVAHPCLF